LTSFAPIYQAALNRVGEVELTSRLPEVKSPEALAAEPDDRYLSLLCLRVFRAGLKHSLVDAKWPGFEVAFLGFDPAAVTAMSDEAMEALMRDQRLIRHWGKLKSVRDNAATLAAISAETGGFGRWIADWDVGNIVGLWDELAKRFSQMGGESGPRFLRMAGKDSFILTGSVKAGLIECGVLKAEPKGKSDRAQVQAQFNEWAAETGRPLAHLSVILAASVVTP
jgi:3-methyladenine DNA glycosylase Tag